MRRFQAWWLVGILGLWPLLLCVVDSTKPLTAQIQSSTARRIVYAASLPATCNPNTGDVYFKTTATVGPYYCSATNTWTAMSGGGGSGTVTSVGLAGTSNQITVTGTSPITGSGSWTLSIPTNPTLPGTTTGTFLGNLTGAVTGNASTATALAANGANCSAGQFPLGVDASGASESCTALPTTIAGTTNQITASASTGAITLSIPTNPTLPGTTTGTFSGNLTGNITGNVTGSSSSTTGNAATATALAANGTNCSAGNYPLGVDASGNAESCTAAATGSVTSVTIAGTANQITASGTCTITTSGTCTLSFPTAVEINGTATIGEFLVASTATTTPRGISSGQWSATTDSARFGGYKGRGTQASPTVITTGDFLTRWSAWGYDGSNYIEAASIVMQSEGTIASTRVPTNIQFVTGTDAAPTVLTTALTLDSAQKATFAGRSIWSVNGALSAPGLTATGTWITGGTATTTKPYLLIEPAGTTSAAWNTSGTGIGVNAVSGFGGSLFEGMVAGSSKFHVDSAGNVVATSGLVVGASSNISFNGLGRLFSPSDGVIRFGNNAASGWTRLAIGPDTTSFPALCPSGTTLQVMVAGACTTFAEVSARTHVGAGTAPTVDATNCTGATIGTGATNSAGTITGLPTGTCSVVLTFNSYTATTGWSCAVSDQTTANLFRQTASTTTTATFAGTSVASDVLKYGPCMAF